MKAPSKSATPLKARIICEQQFCQTNEIVFTIRLGQDKVLRGSPNMLLKKMAVRKGLSDKQLSRLAFMAGVEYMLQQQKRINDAKRQK